MRVAFVVGGFPELSETFILDQMTALIGRGHEVLILARPPADPRARTHATVDEYRLMERVAYWDAVRDHRGAVVSRTGRLLWSHRLRTVGDLARCLAAFRPGENLVRMWSRATMVRTIPVPDVIFAQFGTNGVVAQQVRDICALRIPLVTNFLGHDLSRLLRRKSPAYYARLFARGELMLPLSRYFRERLIAIGCAPDKILVQRLGVDTGRFTVRERTLPPGGAPRFVSVARLVEKKGLEFAMRAFARLRHDLPGATWHLAGDGPLRPDLEELRRTLSLAGSVILHGAMPREEVRRLLDESHIFLAPSVTAADGDQEGTPVAIMEAMASGMPVISTHHSGIAELVSDGGSGLLVAERDVDALSEAMRRLALAPERWGEMGRKGRAIVEREYDVRVLADQLADTLADVVSRGR